MLAAAGASALGGAAGAQAPQAGGGIGAFGPPFVEPTLQGRRTEEKCVPKDKPEFDRELECKPTAGSLNTLPGGGFFYWDALEGTENIEANIVAEYGRSSENDESRVLQLGQGDAPTFTTPSPADGGANAVGGDPNTTPLIPGTGTTEPGNDGSLFCSDQNFMADGRILAVGGTQYLFDPGTAEAPVGATELAGMTSSRIYDPKTATWSQTGRMKQGRWYPSLITLGDGRMLATSGVEKLIKPVNGSGSSGGNVRETEIFDPAKGTWTQNPASANRSLPLFPRLHLLPNGHVFFDSAGQAFNPFGQDYAEAQWNIASSYDPTKQTWTELGVPGLTTGVTTMPGFRGSTSSTMLPLRPDAQGRYTKASFLTAGGVPNPPSPGGYLAVAQAQVNTVDTSGAPPKLTTKETGSLAQGRWYGTQVLLPTGEVVIFSGADRDEVVAPGIETPIKTAEQWDPATGTWRTLASGTKQRTYHNTAALMPDGRVLVGGHAPISTLYAKNQTLVPGITGPNDGRDPTFEIFTPPALQRGPRPSIDGVQVTGGPNATGDQATVASLGQSMTVALGGRADAIESVVLVRFPSNTHVVDADQRSVELPVTRHNGGKLEVTLPSSGNVLPPGPYMLFVNQRTPDGLVPSVSRTVFVGTTAPRMAQGSVAGASSSGTVASGRSCATPGGLRSASATPRGSALRIAFTRGGTRPVTADVFQHSSGRRVIGERGVLRKTGLRGAFTITRGTRPLVDGVYSVRLRTTDDRGRPSYARVVAERRSGRWLARRGHYRRVTCDVLRSYKLERPVFGGSGDRPLRVAFRLARTSDVTVQVLRGRRVVRTVAAKGRPAERTLRLSFPSRGLARGVYAVRITVRSAGQRTLTTTLGAQRL